MITKYNLYKESLLNKISGPSEEEVWDKIKKLNPEDMMVKSINVDLLKGVKLAINNGIDIHIQNEAYLRHACEKGSYNVVKYLLEQGADVNILDEEPLRKAVYTNSADVVKLLLEYGAEVNSYGGHLAINNATKFGKIQILILLTEKLNPNIDVLDVLDYEDANDLLNKSISIDFTRGIKKAVDEGAKIDLANYIPLKYGILNNNYIAVKYILDNYDVNLKNDYSMEMYMKNANDNMKKLLKDKLGI